MELESIYFEGPNEPETCPEQKRDRLIVFIVLHLKIRFLRTSKETSVPRSPKFPVN